VENININTFPISNFLQKRYIFEISIW